MVCKARKSVAGFRLREGMPIGCKVTLRGRRMYEFLDRLISLGLPRVRDFRGLSPKAFDGHGNYSLGLNEQLVFPELNPDKYTRPQGMNIAICCSTIRTTSRANCSVVSGCRSDPAEKQERLSFDTHFENDLVKEIDPTWRVNQKSRKRAKTPKFSSRIESRCRLCGRPRAVYRKFGICRICFRELADQGLIPGVKKASW